MRWRIERDYAWNSGTSGWQQTNEIHFVYDGNLVIQERDINNQPQVTYTRGKDLSGQTGSALNGAGGIGGLLARSDRAQSIPGGTSSGSISEFGTPSYYHADGNGNITMLIAASQMIVAKYLYDPFGNTLAKCGLLADVNNYRFSSKEWNGSSGLYYYLYRYYDPNLQRWVNRDPFLDEGFGAVQMGFYLEQVLFRYIKPNRFLVDQNLYDFVGNDPADEYDYLGLRPGGGPYGPRPSGPMGTPPGHQVGVPGSPRPPRPPCPLCPPGKQTRYQKEGKTREQCIKDRQEQLWLLYDSSDLVFSGMGGLIGIGFGEGLCPAGGGAPGGIVGTGIGHGIAKSCNNAAAGSYCDECQ